MDDGGEEELNKSRKAYFWLYVVQDFNVHFCPLQATRVRMHNEFPNPLFRYQKVYLA